jgi:hypothetical protein
MLTIEQVKQVGIPKNVSKLNNRQFLGVAIPNESVNLYEAIKLVVNEESPIPLDLNNLYSLLGVNSTTTDLGIFSGNIISNNTTMVNALQELEIAIENIDLSALNDLITLTGVSINSNNLGTFLGTIIADNSTIKEALQSLEVAIENIPTSGGGIYSGSGAIASNVIATITDVFNLNYLNGQTALFSISTNTGNGNEIFITSPTPGMSPRDFSIGVNANNAYMQYTGKLTFNISLIEAVFTDTLVEEGIKYAANYHSGYVSRSLVDKEYVDNKVISYTPTDSADTAGTTGNIAFDADYIYIKTGSGWRRASITSF